jgi:hypothetical protein
MTLQIVRRYDVKVQSYGRFAVDGGVAYNVGFIGELVSRDQLETID